MNRGLTHNRQHHRQQQEAVGAPKHHHAEVHPEVEHLEDGRLRERQHHDPHELGECDAGEHLREHELGECDAGEHLGDA